MINETVSIFYQYIAGNPMVMAFIVLFIIIMLLLAVRAGKVIILMLAIPVVSSFMVSTAMIEIPKYFSVLIWIIAGLIFGGAIIAIAFRS